MTDSADRFTHALSVDIGGTFTDFSLLELSTGRVMVNKVLTDPEKPDVALIAGASELLDNEGVDFDPAADGRSQHDAGDQLHNRAQGRQNRAPDHRGIPGHPPDGSESKFTTSTT